MALLKYLENLSEATTVECAWTLHTETMNEYGFDRLLYGFTRFRTANSYGDKQDLMVLTNHDPEYTQVFVNEDMFFNAPMVNWATENVGACSWGWMAKNRGNLTESEKKVVAFNQKMNVTTGYSISFKDLSVRSKGGIGLTSRIGMSQDDTDEVWAEHGRVIIQMNNMVHLKLANLPYSGSRKTLTKRQREALEWVGDGKTTQDIATIMGLTPATIEKHLRLAREALDVETTAQAVLKASFQNQIFVLEA